MSNGTRVLVAEFFVAIMFSSWGSIKYKYAPWPGNYIKIGLAFTMLGILSMASDKLAAWLGAGFIIAVLVRDMSKGPIWSRPNVPGVSSADGGKTYPPDALGGPRPSAAYVPIWFGP